MAYYQNQTCGPNGCSIPSQEPAYSSLNNIFNMISTSKASSIANVQTPCTSTAPPCSLPSWYVSQPSTHYRYDHLRGDNYLCAINPSGTNYDPGR
jgi:hypothetical protein